MTKLVELDVNYEGDTYKLVVPINEANIVLNDPDESVKIVQRYLRAAELIPENKETEGCVVSKEIFAEEIWTKTRPTDVDNEATEEFLKLRLMKAKMFLDKKSSHPTIYNQIAREMEKKYNLGKEGGKKCLNKFHNLQRAYTNYIKHINSTGSEHRKPPPFYDLLHAIFGNKDKFNPKILIDSENTSTPEPTPSTKSQHNVIEETDPSSISNDDTLKITKDLETPEPNLQSNEITMDYENALSDKHFKGKEIVNRFGKKRESKPQTKSNLFVKTFNEQCKKDEANEERRHQERKALKEREIAQRDQFLQLFSQLVTASTSKEERHHSIHPTKKLRLNNKTKLFCKPINKSLSGSD